MEMLEMVKKQSSEMPIEDLKMIMTSVMAATANSIMVSSFGIFLPKLILEPIDHPIFQGLSSPLNSLSTFLASDVSSSYPDYYYDPGSKDCQLNLDCHSQNFQLFLIYSHC